MNVRQMWAAKLAGRPMPAAVALPRNAAASAELSLAVKPRTPFDGVVLGIDPSLRGTGLALIEFKVGRAPLLLRCQTVRVADRLPMSVALAEIHRAVTAFLAGVAVRHVALEQTIYVQNVRTAQILGAARGGAPGSSQRVVGGDAEDGSESIRRRLGETASATLCAGKSAAGRVSEKRVLRLKRLAR